MCIMFYIGFTNNLDTFCMYIDAKNMPTYSLAKQVGYQFWNQKSGPTIRKIFGIARSNLFWMGSPTILEPICHVSWITNPGKRAWWRGSWRSPLRAECEVNNFRRLNRSFRAGYIYIYTQIYLAKQIQKHIPNPTLIFLKQTLELSRLNVSLSELSWSNLGWQCHEHECHGLGRSCSKGHAIGCFWLVWLGHWVSRQLLTNIQAFVLLNWEKVTKENPANPAMYHNSLGAGDKHQSPVFTLHLTQDDSAFSGSPVVAMKGVLVKVRWVMDFFEWFLCLLSIFLFSLLQKGMCFPTNDMGFPSWVVLKMPMLHQQEWQGGRAGSLMEAIFQQSLNVQKCPEVV